jgi:hypothetical protein
MNRKHALLIALLLGLAAVFGAYSAIRTTHLGTASRTAAAAQLAARTQRLNAAEARLKRELARHPAVSAVSATQARKVVYVRPAPIVVHKSRGGGEHEYENEHEDGGGETE